jgi:hypothetical protein
MKKFGIAGLICILALLAQACNINNNKISQMDVNQIDINVMSWQDEPDLKNGDYVKDSTTAERIAEAILCSMYSEEFVNKHKPFLIGEDPKNGVWVVCTNSDHIGDNISIMIRKSDGQIIKVWLT